MVAAPAGSSTAQSKSPSLVSHKVVLVVLNALTNICSIESLNSFIKQKCKISQAVVPQCVTFGMGIFHNFLK